MDLRLATTLCWTLGHGSRCGGTSYVPPPNSSPCTAHHRYSAARKALNVVSRSTNLRASNSGEAYSNLTGHASVTGSTVIFSRGRSLGVGGDLQGVSRVEPIAGLQVQGHRLTTTVGHHVHGPGIKILDATKEALSTI